MNPQTLAGMTLAWLAIASVPPVLAQQQAPPDLKTLSADHQVTAVRFCRGVYTIELRSGASLQFAEFNLRLKTDGSDKGPLPGAPAILPAGMGGDRASIVFAKPTEISALIKEQC